MRTRRWFPFLILGLLAILIGLFVIIFDFQQLTLTNTQNAKSAFNTSSFYQQAIYLAVAQELYEQKYLASPTEVNYDNFQTGTANFTNCIQYMLQENANPDRAALQQISATQQQYLSATNRMVDAIHAHDMHTAMHIDAQQVWPLSKVLQNIMDKAATKEYSQALAHMDEVVAFEDHSSTLLPLICGISFCLLLVMGIILYRVQRSLTKAQQHEIDRFKQSSLTDNLTQLGNHRAYQETYQREIAAAQRHGDTLSLALIDVDEFKQYNDTHGHAYGDHILMTLAQVLGSSRATDQAFRLGGDEFALILRQTEIAEAAQVMERLRASVQQQLAGVTISIGIAMLQPLQKPCVYLHLWLFRPCSRPVF